MRVASEARQATSETIPLRSIPPEIHQTKKTQAHADQPISRVKNEHKQNASRLAHDLPREHAPETHAGTCACMQPSGASLRPRASRSKLRASSLGPPSHLRGVRRPPRQPARSGEGADVRAAPCSCACRHGCSLQPAGAPPISLLAHVSRSTPRGRSLRVRSNLRGARPQSS